MNAAAITIETHDLAFRVDPNGNGEVASRCIDGRKGALAQQKAMNSEAAAVQIKTHDVASRVDPIRSGKQRSLHIDCRKLRRLSRITGCWRRRKRKAAKRY